MTSKEFALKLLEDCGCTVETYQGEPVELILSDLHSGCPDGFPGFTYEQIAEAIYAISTTDRGWKKQTVYDPHAIYATKWGVTDLSNGVEQELRALLATGDPFRTTSLASQKELYAWDMSRTLVGGPITVTVYHWMDEDYDLVNDALPDGFEITTEQADEILDHWISECNGSSETSEAMTLPGESSLDDILPVVSFLANKAADTLQERFSTLQGIVSDFLDALEADTPPAE